MKLRTFNPVWFLAGFLAQAPALPAATYDVGSLSALTTRINAAVAGDEIVVSNGLYVTSASLGISRAGTAADRIIVRAETVGGAEISGTHGFSFNSGAAYVTVQGFKFTHAAAINMTGGANHCRLTRNIIELTIPAGSDVSYVNISGDDMEVDHNELRNKSTLGEMLDITGSGSQVARRLWVHHNYFHDFTSPGGNGAETIRWGLSGLSLSTGDGLCEYNLFVRCEGENEMISNKSSGNIYRYNTVLDCVGGEISQRHGNDCVYCGNYMRNTQGMRIYGDRHKIFSNYFESNSIGVNMGNGDGDVYNGDPLTSHDRPDDNIVVYNTFINNGTHYEMGGRTGGLGSSNTVVADNIFQGGGSMASISSSAPYTGTWSNNIRWQTSSAGNMPASGYVTVNPLLLKDASGAFHIQSGSPAINAGVGSYDSYGLFSSYPYVSVDMDRQPRDADKDIGADEFSSTPVAAHILSANEVGPYAMEGAFTLAAAPPSRTVPPGTLTNVSYTVTITDLSGSNATVVLGVGGLPAGTSAGFTPASVNGSGSSALNVTVSNTAAPGNYILVITGSGPSATNGIPVSLLISRPPAKLRWASTGSGVWDVATTANWFNLDRSASDRFFAGDSVLFDDSANVATSISVSTAVTPATMTNDSTMNDFTVSGAGWISGTGGIVKKGGSTLTLSTANDFSGPVTILGGTVRVGSTSALGSTAAGTAIANGGTLDINGMNLSGESVTVSGAGADGAGALVNRGAQQTSALKTVTLAGDTTFGGTGRWDIRGSPASLLTGGQPYRITKTGTNQVSLVAVNPIDAALGDIEIEQGVLAVQTTTAQLGDPNKTITVFPGATLDLWQLTSSPLDKKIVLQDGARIWNEKGPSVIIGPVTLAGDAVFDTASNGVPATLTISNALSGGGGLVKTGGGTLALSGANTYTGSSVVSTGTLALVGSGSIGNSETITITDTGTLDVSGRSDGRLTLSAGQTLKGNGTVNGNLVVGTDAVVAPGATVGALTVAGQVQLSGTTSIELDRMLGTNDVIRGATINYGGTLVLTNLAGTPGAGDRFRLFYATNYSGAFTSIVPAAPGVGLRWDTNSLTIDGTLALAFVPSPTVTNITLTATNLLLAGGNGTPGASYRVLSATNLAFPLADWSVIGSDVFDSDGRFAFSADLEPVVPQRFYVIQLP